MSAGRMFEVDAREVGVTLDRFAHLVGETTEQATIRLGVAVARNLAQETNPQRSTASKRKKAAAATMRRVVEPMPARHFNKLKKQTRPRVKLEGRWVEIPRAHLLEGESEIYRTVERNRVMGRTRALPREQRYVCKEADFNRVVRKRAQLWGVAKGSWLGAGMEIGRRQKGLQRNTIGANFLAWAQKHAGKGSGRQDGRDHETTVTLTSRTAGAASAKGLSVAGAHRAITRARKALFAYYKAELRRMRANGRRGR